MNILTASYLGYHIYTKPFEERMWILRTDTRRVAYDNGFKKKFCTHTLVRWKEKIEYDLLIGKTYDLVGNSNHKGTENSIEKIKKSHPRYIESLLRHALHIKGSNTSFDDITLQMNLLSSYPSNSRPSLTLTRRQVNNWIRDNIGKYIFPFEKPLDIELLFRQRKQWVVENVGLSTHKLTPVALLDEKWFYHVNRRRKIKYLPYKKVDANFNFPIPRWKSISRRFPPPKKKDVYGCNSSTSDSPQL